jgi:hypothetical protein
VEGPTRWTSTNTAGSSAATASPIISVISENPGPEVAVIAFLPANEAPRMAPAAAISSSVWTMNPPIFGSSFARNSMMSDAGVIG